MKTILIAIALIAPTAAMADNMRCVTDYNGGYTCTTDNYGYDDNYGYRDDTNDRWGLKPPPQRTRCVTDYNGGLHCTTY